MSLLFALNTATIIITRENMIRGAPNSGNELSIETNLPQFSGEGISFGFDS